MSPESIGGNVPRDYERSARPDSPLRRRIRVPRPVAERVLTLRGLNRATLARQLLLQRTRLSPTAVIERLVGMQAQSPQAPYVGIWTRTTGFRRGSLERLLRQSAIVRATATRQTLHLVTRRDYALIRAAFPWETERAKQLAPSVRALAAGDPSRRRRRSPTWRASTASPASMRAAPGRRRASQRTSSTTPRRRSGSRATSNGLSRSRNRRRTSWSRRASRSSAATSRPSAPRRAATSEPGA